MTRCMVRALMGVLACLVVGGCSTAPGAADRTTLSPRPGALEQAAGGDSEAQCLVGWSYLMDHNYTEAVRWLQKAADAGNRDAMCAAGKLFIDGRGVAKDVSRGIRYLRQGAECPAVAGNVECALDLAGIYERGKLVPRDVVEAYYYLGLAIVNWDDDVDGAKQRLKPVERKIALGARLTAKERETQDARVSKWVDDRKAEGWSPPGERGLD
jgi:hypothetical protein